MIDIVIIGAGPAGLSMAAHASSKGFSTVVVEQGCIAHSFYRYPGYLRFFASTEELAIAGLPFISISQNPSRTEVLRYYQKAARRINTEFRLRTRVVAIQGSDNAFLVKCEDPVGEEIQLRCKKVVVASGSFQAPRMMYIPGEDLPKVSHMYSQPYEYEGSDVLIVGGGNSSAHAALELIDNNVRVIVSYRQDHFSRLKPWVQSRLEDAMASKRLECHFSSLLKEIRPREVVLWIKERGEQVVPNDFVLLLTGYRPDTDLLKQAGIVVTEADARPAYFQENCETNIAGIYLAGIVQSGINLDAQSIGDFREHAEVIVKDILEKM